MNDKQMSSCIELSEIRKLDQLLTQCETSSCEHICRDCCAKLGSLEDITDHQDDEVVVAVLGDSAEPCHSDGGGEDDDAREGVARIETHTDTEDMEQRIDRGGGDGSGDVLIRDQGPPDKIRMRLLTNESAPRDMGNWEDEHGMALNVPGGGDREEMEAITDLPPPIRGRLCRADTDATTLCMEPLTCDRRLNYLTVNKASMWICDNCEKRNRRSDQRRHGGHKKHSLTISEKPPKMVRLEHKCSSENCLKHQQHNKGRDCGSSSLRQKPLAEQQRRSSPSSDTISGKGSVHRQPKLSPQIMGRRISCKIPDDLEASAREALLGARISSLPEKKLPEPVDRKSVV